MVQAVYVEKVFNWSEVHLSEMTCYKIHALETLLEEDSFRDFRKYYTLER